MSRNARRGRPAKSVVEKRGQRLDLRVSEAEKATFKLAAANSDLDLSVWIRVHLHRAAREALGHVESSTGPDEDTNSDGTPNVE